jgi:hypothetical protein
MTPEQLAELFVEEQCDNTMNIHTCIEILVKNAYKAGYACAVDKTEEWLDDRVAHNSIDYPMATEHLTNDYRKAMEE